MKMVNVSFKLGFIVIFTIIANVCKAESGSFINPKGAVAAAQLKHLYEITAVTMIAILPVFVLVPIILWRYRYRNQSANYSPEWDKSRLLDVVMWGIPLAIIAFAGTLLWHSTKTLDPYRPIEPTDAATHIQVVGLDWKWLFIYPDEGIATVGEMAFPAAQPLALDLTSDTVMQSFMIGALGGQIYAMPGMETQLHLIADGEGSFEGENMQYSGAGFHTQKFRANALSAEEYVAWIDTVRQSAIPLDDETYAILAERGTKDDLRAALPNAIMEGGVVVFALTDQSIFETILARYQSGDAVSPAAQPGALNYQSAASSEARHD